MPDLEETALKDYLTSKIEAKSITCRRIETVGKRFASFQATFECDDPAVVYDASVWPEGSYVRL